jgi:hypothetical protein
MVRWFAIAFGLVCQASAGSAPPAASAVATLDSGSFPSSTAEAAGSTNLRNAARGALAERLDRTLPDYLQE